jgi:hypothetical protein
VNTRERSAEGPVESQDVGTAGSQESHFMELLQGHVPLSLLMDLSSRSGPNSEAILDEEGTPDDAWWEQR